MGEVNYLFIASAAFIAVSSPGPATLAISSVSMSQGRKKGLTLAAGVLTGSLIWSFSAAFGLSAVMYANSWLLDAFRYLAASYLIFLSYKSLRSAISLKPLKDVNTMQLNYHTVYLRGLLIHLTNPKAVLFFGALYSIGLPSQINTIDLIKVISLVALISGSVFTIYAVLFSVSKIRTIYMKSQRYFECIYAAFFGVAGLKILTSNIMELDNS